MSPLRGLSFLLLFYHCSASMGFITPSTLHLLHYTLHLLPFTFYLSPSTFHFPLSTFHFLTVLMYLTRKVKFNIRVIGSFRIQKPFTLGQVHHMSVLILRNIGLFETGKFQ